MQLLSYLSYESVRLYKNQKKRIIVEGMYALNYILSLILSSTLPTVALHETQYLVRYHHLMLRLFWIEWEFEFNKL